MPTSVRKQPLAYCHYTTNRLIFRCEEHLYKRLRPLVGRSVGWSVPTMQLCGKLVTLQLLREEEEEETDYVAIPLRRNSFAPRD
jgi:hypothetical protein